MTRFALILLACATATAGGTAAGQTGATTYYVFASSNRAPELTDEGARRKLSSFEETNAIAVADRAACALAGEARISGSVGVYDGSAENSFLVESRLERSQAEYLGALLGSYERQQNVLLFSALAGGRDRLWIIKTPRVFEAVAAEVRKWHMTPASVRFEESATQVWIVDLGNRLGERPKELAADLSATASSQDGSAELLGDEKDRAKADEAYRGTIRAFEQHSPLRFSDSVPSEQWSKASGRTCSRELPR